jgi:ABC-type transporter Mla maintaining outer membrane lipid asymmetry permease subunit MlaE
MTCFAGICCALQHFVWIRRFGAEKICYMEIAGKLQTPALAVVTLLLN